MLQHTHLLAFHQLCHLLLQLLHQVLVEDHGAKQKATRF